MGTPLLADDEYSHPVGPQPSWNESRYLDFYDPLHRVGGWFRLGNRPNESSAELSVCLYLPDGSVAVAFGRPAITDNRPAVAGMRWSVDRPFEESGLTFEGTTTVVADPRSLSDPKRAFSEGRAETCRVALRVKGAGLRSVLGRDQDHVARIFLPGQAHGHFQHLVRSTGTVSVGDRRWEVDGRGARDHSWGPRNWFAKRYFRWLIGSAGDEFGFMATRGVGHGEERRGGFVWEDGTFHLLDHVEVRSRYTGAQHVHSTTYATLRSGERAWTVEGRVISLVPLRSRQAGSGGTGAPGVLRITKAPTEWMVPGGRIAYGMTEYHDQMVDGLPAGLAE